MRIYSTEQFPKKYSLSARQPSGAITDVKKMKVSLTNFEKKI